LLRCAAARKRMNRWLRHVLALLAAVALFITVLPFMNVVLAQSPSPQLPLRNRPPPNPDPTPPQQPPLVLPPLPPPPLSDHTIVDKLPMPEGRIEAAFTPNCKGEQCLLDIWRDSERRVVFMTRGRPLACVFRSAPDGEIVSSPTSKHHSAALGAEILSCLVPEGMDPAQDTAMTVTVQGRELPLPPYQREQQQQQRRYNLAAVIMFRIFREDLFNITFFELQEWLEAMFHMGVEHVYMYDNWVAPEEAQLGRLAPYIAAGLVTYHPWPLKKPYGYPFSQQSAYTHCLWRYRAESEWMLQADVDEYPVVHGDTAPGYLLRLVRKIAATRPDVSQFHFQSVFFGPIETPRQHSDCSEQPCETRCNRPLLIERYQHREDQPQASLRIKPVFRPASMQFANVHRYVGAGATIELSFSQAWLLHYWGFRCKDSCPRSDNAVQPLAAYVRARLRKRDCGPDS